MTISKLLASLSLGAVLLIGVPSVGESAKYKEADVANGGSVAGAVKFEGAVPDDAIEKILITKNPDVCGTGEREVVWVDVKDGALRGAFVFIDKIAEGKKWAEPAGGAYLIAQKGCRFNPWAQVVKRGPITIRNSDNGVLHNINTREMIGVEKGRVVMRTMFNFGQPDPGDIQQNIKPRRSSFIAMNCEAHNFMFGFMMAPEHPYAVVVGEDGSYSLDNVPPGTYTLKAWHPRFGLKESEVTITEGAAAEASFTFSQ